MNLKSSMAQDEGEDDAVEYLTSICEDIDKLKAEYYESLDEIEL
jgi:hypothetical protein